jgi:hypothetical protein
MQKYDLNEGNDALKRVLLMMNYDNKKTLTENVNGNVVEDCGVIITDWLSPDEKFVIFLDELYDITNKKLIGNIWENFDNFKFFLKHSFEVSKTVPQHIKESVLDSISKLVISESKQNITHLKPMFKGCLNEGWFDDTKNWVSKTLDSTIKGVKDFAKKSYEGGAALVDSISKGDWSQVFDLIKKGSLYVARKIREALYSPVGLILDAILIATGIGKAAQFVIWGIVVALDIYELVSGDYEDKEESFLVRMLFTGIDIIGLVFAGVAAKAGKGVVANILRKFGTSTKGLSNAAKSSPVFKSLLEKMRVAAEGASSIMGRVGSYLQKNSPTLYKWFSGIIGGLGKIVTKIIDSIKSVLGTTMKVVSKPGQVVKKVLGGGRLGKGSQAALNTTALVGGIGVYGQHKQAKEEEELISATTSNKDSFEAGL